MDMSESDLKEFKELLLARRNLLRGDLDTLQGEALKLGAEGAGDLSTMPGHQAELASDNSEREISYGRIESPLPIERGSPLGGSARGPGAVGR